MNQLFISFAAGFRAGVTGLLATGVGGPGLGMGVAIGSLAATATETNQGALVRRPGFSPGAGLTGLFTAVALGGYVFTAILDSQAEERVEAALQTQTLLTSNRVPDRVSYSNVFGENLEKARY